MRTKTRIITAAAFGFLSLLLMLAYSSAVRDEASRERDEALARYGGEIVEVVCATHALEAGDVLMSSDVVLRDWVVDLVPEDAYGDVGELVGQTVSVPVAAGAPLVPLNFRNSSELSDIPAGHVALSIPVTDRLGIPREIALGTQLVAYRVNGDGVRLLASNMSVLRPPVSESAYSSTQSLTLAVLPEDVATILQASSASELRLVMPADDVVSLSPEKAQPEAANPSKADEPQNDDKATADHEADKDNEANTEG